MMLAIYFGIDVLPELHSGEFVRIVINCVLITALMTIFIRLFNISDDVNSEMDKILRRIGFRKFS